MNICKYDDIYLEIIYDDVAITSTSVRHRLSSIDKLKELRRILFFLLRRLFFFNIYILSKKTLSALFFEGLFKKTPLFRRILIAQSELRSCFSVV